MTRPAAYFMPIVERLSLHANEARRFFIYRVTKDGEGTRFVGSI